MSGEIIGNESIESYLDKFKEPKDFCFAEEDFNEYAFLKACNFVEKDRHSFPSYDIFNDVVVEGNEVSAAVIYLLNKKKEEGVVLAVIGYDKMEEMIERTKKFVRFLIEKKDYDREELIPPLEE